jgi:small-conductance mechanosensitive channel
MGAADKADAAREQQLFEIESRPIWEVFTRKAPGRDFGEQLKRVTQHNVSAMNAFLREEGTGFFWVSMVFLAVVVAVAWAGRAFAARAASDPELAAPAEVLSHPIAAGVVVAMSVTTWLLPRAPAVFSELTVLFTLPAFLLLARNLLPGELRGPLYGFTALFALTRLGALLPESSLPGRLLILTVSAVGLVGSIRMLRNRAPWTQAIRRPRRKRQLRVAVSFLAVALAVALVANVIGNVSLARRLTDGGLSTGMLALILSAVARVLNALLVGFLRMPEVHRVQTLAENADLIAERGAGFIEWAALIFWGLGTLKVFYVEAVVLEAVRSTLTARFKFGGLDVALGDLVAFGVALYLSVLLSRLLRVGLEAYLDRDARLPAGVPAAISKTVGYVVVGVGFLVAILASGMDVTRFTVILGTLTVGIGFGLQNVVNNFVSGLILLYERPIRVGDVIDVGTATGTVTHIGIRSSTIKTFQGAEVVLPNSSLVANQLTNWTLSDRIRRVEIEVGVAYGSDPAKVQELLLLAARTHTDVLSDPAPLALFTGLGDSALNFQLRFWTAQFDRYLAIASEVRSSVVEKLDGAGISIPFPQQDVHVVSVEEGAVKALRGPPAGK